MAWKDTLLDASFRGVKFDCQRTDDTLDRNVARYAYPNIDGEDIEDLGAKANEVSITAVFFGDDYETHLKAFLNALSQKGKGELVHPVFGSMPNMQFLGGHVSHDAENVDTCFLEMRFANSTPSNPFFVQQLTNQKADATAQLATVAQSSGTSMFQSALDKLKAAKAALRQLNALRDVMGQVLGPIKNLVTGFQSTVLDFINFPSAYMSDVIGLVSGMTDFRSFDPGMVMSDWSGLLDQMNMVVKLPAAAANGQSLTIPGTTSTVATSTEPVDPAAPYFPRVTSVVAASPADVAVLTAAVKVVVATVMAGVASDVLANEADTPTLTPEQIEQVCDDTRNLIQDAIDETRNAVALADSRPVIECLKDVALSVQELAISVIDALPPLITRTVAARTNLTLLAFRWYGDYTRSAELLRLNPSVRNPNFIERGEVLRGFAQ